MNKPEQMNIFTRKIRFALLVAFDSPRQAFYRIWIESDLDNFKIVKESGVKGRRLDKRIWPADSLETAQKIFTQRIRSKTNPDRKSPRKYKLITTG